MIRTRSGTKNTRIIDGDDTRKWYVQKIQE